MGLSPRMRGSRADVDDGEALEGPIPAHAGEPAWVRLSPDPQGAYPRACGGAHLAAEIQQSCAGLSPRMRGSRGSSAVRIVSAGPIPAHAGEPVELDGAGIFTGAYPRACGGAMPSALALAPLRGLSPRMRGSLRPAAGPHPVGGPIPAHAGEPSAISAVPRVTGAYPRACGGAKAKAEGIRAGVGLSPRMRGSRRLAARAGALGGPIPAHAGEPMPRTARASAGRAYPRACGGAQADHGDHHRAEGLSPRMRGSQ